MKRYVLLALFALLGGVLQAQKGYIRGTVLDASTGESLIGVTVSLPGTTVGTITDLDGKFSLALEPGTYAVQFTYVSFQPQKVEGVLVEAGEAAVLGNIILEEAVMELGEVVVRAEAVRATETSMMLIKQKSVSMLDGISSERMQLTGDATAADAARRVTGVTVEGGKYVYVRGLGDRYAKTLLNNMDIPGLDPDRNSLQMDIFPTNLIQNISVSKNFTADMPGDFTGGLMNVETIDFPDQRTQSVSVGVGFNPDMHLNGDYLTYDGGRTDLLGFDDGTRALPERATNAVIPTPTSGFPASEVNAFVRDFSPTLATRQATSPLDFSFGYSFGNQYALKPKGGSDRSLGLVASLSYRSETRFYDDVRYGEFQRYSDDTRNELRYATLQEGQLGEQSTLLGGMLGLAYKTQRSKIKLTAMHLQSGESRAARLDIDNDGEAVGQSGYRAYSDNLEYNQRSMSNLLLSGTHLFGTGWELDWRVSPTYSVSDDPDIRKTAFTVTGLDTFFSAGAGGNPSRIWRSLNEINLSSRVDLSKTYGWKDREARIKFGAMQTYRARDYEILFFDIQFFGNQSWPNPTASEVLAPENLYDGTVKPNSLYYQSGNSQPNPNAYSANISNTALYASNEMPLSASLKAILGVRMEYYVQRHTGRDQAFASGDIVNGRNLVNETVLETLNFFPSVNLIQAITSRQNLRLGYSRSVARPSFKEISFAQILDPITNRIFNGSLFQYANAEGEVSWNGRLLETDIDNLDLRWEHFGDRGQLWSAGAFFKRFQNPIELVRIPEQQTSTEFQPRNIGQALVYGVELEARRHLGFLAPALEALSVNVNVTLAQSVATMSEVEFEARKAFERDGETITDTRQMAGQSPYVINAGLIYSPSDKGRELGLFYNVQGPTLEVVGIGLYPDVYTEPFHSLNASFTQKLGAEGRTVLDLRVSNLLDDRRESFYRSFGADPAVFNSLNPGRSFSVGLSHRF